MLPNVTIGGTPARVGFAGMTPGSIGLAQFNIQVPAVLPPGDNLSLVIDFNGFRSSPVPLYFRETLRSP